MNTAPYKHDLAPGFVFGAFRIGPAIATKGRTRRWLARSSDGGEVIDCVLEMLPAAARERPDQRAWFRERMRLASQLHHSGVECCLAAGRFRGVLYLVHERVPGIDLAEVASRWFPESWDPSVVRHIAGLVASALAYTHRYGVAHGSLGPRHIRLEKHGRIRICGFEGPSEVLTPEDDVAALGRLLHQLIAVSSRRGWPLPLLDVVKRMCDPDPKLRPTAAEVVRTLSPISAAPSALAGLHKIFSALQRSPGLEPRPEVTAVIARNLSFGGAGDVTVRAPIPVS